jgi:ribosomal protein L11 methyltransferase
LIRLAVRCPAPLADRVLAELLALVPGGVEEVGPIERGRFEYAIYGPAGELPALPDLEAAAGDDRLEISSSEIPDDWADRWRDFHRPVSIAGGRIVVRPSWWAPRSGDHPAGADAGADEEGPSRRRGQGAPAGAEQRAGIDLVIDPGRAFGTGAHATTRMCLELLLELADSGDARGAVADLGTGSGVLAIAAARLGWGPVLACDSEPAALDAAAGNGATNGVELALERINLRECPAPASPTVIANLTAPLLVSVASRLAEPPKALICSGLLAAEAEQVLAALARAGLRLVAERSTGEWTAFLLARGSEADPG